MKTSSVLDGTYSPAVSIEERFTGVSFNANWITSPYVP